MSPRRLIDSLVEGKLKDACQAFEDELKRRYPQLDVLAMYVRSEDSFPHVYVAAIELDPASRNRGLGSKIIGEIQDWARQRGMPVMLSRDDRHGKKTPLDRFYRRLGFDRNTGRRRELRGTGTHIWRP